MIEYRDSKILASWQVTNITEQVIMHSSYNRRGAAIAGETGFTYDVVTSDDLPFTLAAIRKGILDLKMTLAATSLHIESRVDDDECSITITLPDNREIAASELEILESLWNNYIVESLLREWATVTNDSTSLAKCAKTIDSLMVAINEALLWIVIPARKRGYTITYLT